jgi:hypothetical protein
LHLLRFCLLIYLFFHQLDHFFLLSFDNLTMNKLLLCHNKPKYWCCHSLKIYHVSRRLLGATTLKSRHSA